MIGYRSIGESELLFLVNSENPLYGKFKYSTLKESGCTLPYGVVSFYVDDIKWHDSHHYIDIKVLLPDDAQIGTAFYMSAPSFAETKVFTGRTGKTRIKVKEAYIRFYEPQDIMEIDLHMRYASHYVNGVIKPFCEKYNISLKWENKTVFERKNKND